MESQQQQQLTERDLEVTQLLLEGKSNKQIALRLGVSTRAVEQPQSRIYEKLGVLANRGGDKTNSFA